MRAKTYLMIAGVGLLLAPVSVDAHHAFSAEFDANKPVTLRGTITKVDWTNPHIWIHLEVKDPNGKVNEWQIEGGAPNAMFRRGWNMESIKPGTQVSIDGFQAKNSKYRANGKDVLLPDGRKLFVGSTGNTGAPYDANPKP